VNAPTFNGFLQISINLIFYQLLNVSELLISKSKAKIIQWLEFNSLLQAHPV